MQKFHRKKAYYFMYPPCPQAQRTDMQFTRERRRWWRAWQQSWELTYHRNRNARRYQKLSPAERAVTSPSLLKMRRR